MQTVVGAPASLGSPNPLPSTPLGQVSGGLFGGIGSPIPDLEQGAGGEKASILDKCYAHLLTWATGASVCWTWLR